MDRSKSSSNPTKVPDTKAVAVKQSDGDGAPVITAKGHGFNAEKILEIAFAEGVKVRQDKDLTELLDAFGVDCPVPLEALHAVSLILERVYAENKNMDPREQHDKNGTVAAPDAAAPNASDMLVTSKKGDTHG